MASDPVRVVSALPNMPNGYRLHSRVSSPREGGPHTGTHYALTLSRRHGKNMLRAVHVVDLTGERVGTFTVVEWTGKASTRDGSRIWLLRCDCGAVKLLSLSRIRRYQKAGCRPQCVCDEYKRLGPGPREIKPRGPRKPRAAFYANGRCRVCEGLSWQVVGKACRSCGLAFGEERPVAIEIPTLCSSAGRCLDAAPGGWLSGGGR